jgi:NADP-dependent 3-hydroxy acid dehydrogenase YdfG
MTKEQAQKYYESRSYLEPKDVAESVLYALATPPHVQVSSFLSSTGTDHFNMLLDRSAVNEWPFQ